MTNAALPEDSTAILDSSVLIAMGRPSNPKYRAFERYVTRRSIAVAVPTPVVTELRGSPAGYEQQRDRLQAALDAGWLSIAAVDFTDSDVATAIDRTRKRMANLSADDVTEDEIEKTDTVLAGLAWQHATDGAVTVLVSDAIAERAIGDVLDSVPTATVIEGRTFLDSLVDQQLE